MGFSELFPDLTGALQHPSGVWIFALSYLSGSIPFGYLFVRFKTGKDIQHEGSGNIGATNVSRVIGKPLGFVVLGLDALKGALPVLVVWQLQPAADAPAVQACLEFLAAFCALLGHCFPVWLKFHGGKGAATGVGGMLAFWPVFTVIPLVTFGIVFAITRVVSLGSIAGAIMFPATWMFLKDGVVDGQGVIGLAYVFVILARHSSNIARVLKREERKLS